MSLVFSEDSMSDDIPEWDLAQQAIVYAQELERETQQGEVRIVDAQTGGEKGMKLARFDLIPPEAHWALAEVYGKGSTKYADRNWEKGYKWGLSVAALERHLNAWKRGESVDPETGCDHLMQVAWHAFCLFTFELRGLGTDDVRVKGLQAK